MRRVVEPSSPVTVGECALGGIYSLSREDGRWGLVNLGVAVGRDHGLLVEEAAGLTWLSSYRDCEAAKPEAVAGSARRRGCRRLLH